MAIVSYTPITINAINNQYVYKANSPLKYVLYVSYSTSTPDNSLSLIMKKSGVIIGSFVLVRFSDPEPVGGNWACYFVCDCIGLIASDLDKQSFTIDQSNLKTASTIYEFLINGTYSHSAAFCNSSAQYGENAYLINASNQDRSFYAYQDMPVRLWALHPTSKDLSIEYNGTSKSIAYGGEGVPVIRYVDTIFNSPGTYDLVVTASGGGTSVYTSKVYVLPAGCRSEQIKYVDRNGMVQSWAFESIKTDSSSITGRYTVEQEIVSEFNSNIKGLGVEKSRSIKLKTGLIEKKFWGVIDDIISSPVLLYKYGSVWVAVEVQTKQIDTSKMKYNFFDFDIELKMPKQYTVKYL